MGDNSKIEWTDASWNPVTGCSHVSPGCDHCYAETLSHRYQWTTKPWGAQHAAENVQLHPKRLDQPLRWRRPRRIFVNSMSDLFHEQVPDEFIDRVFTVMLLAPHHVFQVLTKRPERMRDYCCNEATVGSVVSLAAKVAAGFAAVKVTHAPDHLPGIQLGNCWLGVSVEDQRRADERIPLLLETPAAVRFLSCEPLLAPITFPLPCKGSAFWGGLHWVIVGGESGPGARPMEVQWARSIVDQCRAAGVSIFCKQMGSVWARSNGGDRKGGDPSEWPEDLRLREYPMVPRT